MLALMLKLLSLFVSVIGLYYSITNCVRAPATLAINGKNLRCAMHPFEKNHSSSLTSFVV